MYYYDVKRKVKFMGMIEVFVCIFFGCYCCDCICLFWDFG